MKASVLKAMILGLGVALAACGGGSGVGPNAVNKREDTLRDRLPLDWNSYNAGDFQSAIDFFSSTLQDSDLLNGEGVEGVRKEVKSEAQNGIGWAFFRTQDLDLAANAFRQATNLSRRNADAWAGWAGVALAQQRFADVIQFASQALEIDPNYSSANRADVKGRNLGHDRFDARHLHLALAEAYFQLGRYSASDRPDPNNAAAQLRLIDSRFRFRDPGQLLEEVSRVSLELQQEINLGS